LAAESTDSVNCVFMAVDASSCCGMLGALEPLASDTPCVFAIPFPPGDPGNVAVYLDKRPVPKSQTDGREYGATTATLVLMGTYCDAVTSDTSSARVSFVCGCPLVPPSCIP
jgi:hypothetical protein